MVAMPQIGRKLARKRIHKAVSETTAKTETPRHYAQPGALSELLQTFRDEAARMTPEDIAQEDAQSAKLMAALQQNRVSLPVPDLSVHD